jgi:hypothetical protein
MVAAGCLPVNDQGPEYLSTGFFLHPFSVTYALYAVPAEKATVEVAK